MIIDSHQHVFWHGRDDKALIADMEQNQIDVSWLLSGEIPPYPFEPKSFFYASVLNPARVREDGSHPGILLEDLLVARDRYPDRFVLGYCPDPQKPNAVKLFEEAVKMHGVKVCGEWKFRMHLDDPRCLELFRAAGAAKAPVVLHMDPPYLKVDGKLEYQPSWYGGMIENLERAVAACPETNFIGHAPGFWRYMSGDAAEAPTAYPDTPVKPGGQISRLMQTYPNMYADLSSSSGLRALKRDPQHAIKFLTQFADRILFARDYFGGEHLEFLRTLELPQPVREKLMFRNALKLVDPKAPPALTPVVQRLAP